MKKNSKKESKYKMTISKFFKHLHTVNKHRFKVFILCCKAGQPWRGLLHDLSINERCYFRRVKRSRS